MFGLRLGVLGLGLRVHQGLVVYNDQGLKLLQFECECSGHWRHKAYVLLCKDMCWLKW